MAHAAALPMLSVADAYSRLYDFNRQPLTPAWAAALPDALATAGFLGIERPPPPYTAVADTHWLHFHHPQATGPLVHKLYVSTSITALPRLVAATLPLFAELAIPAFKLGARAADLLRPDHMVLYFASPEQRDHVAAEIATTLLPLAGPLVPAVGVPFTAAIAADTRGLLSWGTDSVRGVSHRSFVVEIMAAALAAVGSAPGDRIAAMRARLTDAGICPDRFEPLRTQ